MADLAAIDVCQGLVFHVVPGLGASAVREWIPGPCPPGSMNLRKVVWSPASDTRAMKGHHHSLAGLSPRDWKLPSCIVLKTPGGVILEVTAKEQMADLALESPELRVG